MPPPLFSRNETLQIRYDVYLHACLPISIVGLLGNPLILAVWSREKYHPTRFLYMILAVCHFVKLIFIHIEVNIWKNTTHFGDVLVSSLFTFDLLASVPRYFSSCISLLISIVQGLWLHSLHDSPFFTCRWIAVEAGVLYLWSLILRAIALTPSVSKRTRAWLKITFDVIGVVLPRMLQLIVFGLLPCRGRSGQGSSTSGPNMELVSTVWDDSGKQELTSEQAADTNDGHETSLTVLSERQELMDRLEERSLTRAVLIMSVVGPILNICPFVAVIYYQPREHLRPLRDLAKSARLTAMTVDMTMNIFVFVVLFPSFRKPFQQLYRRLCCRCTGTVVPQTQRLIRPGTG